MIEEVLIGIVVAGGGYVIKTCSDIKERITRVETIQRFQLKHDGVNDKEIDCELINHKNRRKKK